MRILILGGARSGKSALAEQIAASLQPSVTYLATAEVTDSAMAERVLQHQQRRPGSWTTIDVGTDLPQVLAATSGTVLVDSLGTWLVRFEDFEAPVGELTSAIASRTGLSVIVSEEVGLGVHPSTQIGGAFRDALGLLNQAVAAACDEVFLCVAGRALALADASSVVDIE